MENEYGTITMSTIKMGVLRADVEYLKIAATFFTKHTRGFKTVRDHLKG